MHGILIIAHDDKPWTPALCEGTNAELKKGACANFSEMNELLSQISKTEKDKSCKSHR